MIEITSNREGTLTEVIAVCPTEQVAIGVREIFRKSTSYYTTEPGSLVVRVKCNRREASNIVEQVGRLSYRTSPAKPLRSVAAGDDTSGRHRELIQATDMSEWTTPKHITVNGQRLTLTGFGREFIGSELHGHLWGERVRYAYYSADGDA